MLVVTQKIQTAQTADRILLIDEGQIHGFGTHDATQTMVSKIADDLYEVQVFSWYDNENSYTSQMVRTIKFFAELG